MAIQLQVLRGDFPELVAETLSWTLADGILNQDGYHRLISKHRHRKAYKGRVTTGR